MGRSVSVLVGTYLVCNMSAQPVDVDVVRCSNTTKHSINEDDKFCSTCGAKTERTVRVENEYQSLHSVLNGDVVLPSADRDWLVRHFTPTWNVDFVEDGQEIITYDAGCVGIDGDDDGAHALPATGFTSPSAADVDKLCELMGYTHVEVKCGVIVINSY